MRILYFTRDFTTHDHRFLTSLSKTVHDVYLIRLEWRKFRLEERPVPSNVQEINWAGGQPQNRVFNLPKLWISLRKVIRKVQPDLIHAGPIQNAGFLAALCKFHPLVIMSWGSDLLMDADRNILWKLTTRYTLKRSTVFIGDCSAVRKKAVSFGVPNDRIVTFPWGIDLNIFSPGKDGGLRERLKWHDNFVLLSVRAWEPIYGVDIVVKAFVVASRVLPNLRLILLGGGSQESLLRGIIGENNLDTKVFFGGQISQDVLPSYYRTADIYLSSSHSDGSSVSLMEALACACPVIVSDIPGNREWITSGVEGYIFPDGDIKALAKTIVKAAQNKNKLIDMKHHARSLAEKRADWSRNFQQLLRAYEMTKTTGRES